MLNRVDDGFIDVSAILEPRSIVVVGASDRPGNFGGATVRHLLKFGFGGSIWPVNRAGADVAGIASFASIAALPGPADLAVLAVPAEALFEAVRDLATRGVRAGIAFAGGLGEAGGEGLALQDRLAALCRDTGFALCGPNCVGVINAALPAPATFATALDPIDVLRPGAISMVSQSGGIGTTAFSLSLEAGFGFRYLVSSGNEAVVDFSDYLAAFARDAGTRVVAGYLEGLRDGDKFIRALTAARTRGKPVVLIKSGATRAGARAALAHTGALAGEDRVFDAVLGELGVIRAYSVRELIDIAAMLSAIPPGMAFGPGIGIATFGGGNGVIAADQCAQHGLETPPLGADIVGRLKPLLPSVATAANPIDLTPTTAFRDEFLSRLPEALAVVAEEPAIDALLLIVGTLASRAGEITAVIDEIVRRTPKPVCVAWPFPPAGLVADLAGRGIHAFEEVADAVRALTRLARRPAPAAPALPAGPGAAFDWTPFVGGRDDERIVAEHRCHAIMRAAGLPVAAGAVAGDEEAAAAAAEAVGFPVALKGVSAAVTHRAAAGLVILGARDAQAVRHGVRTLRERARRRGIALDGVHVQRMEAGDAELLVAATRDPLFGTMVSVGAGGVHTELIDDVVIRRAPVDVETAAGMIEALRIRRHARDADGALPTARAAAFLARFSELAVSAPWRRFAFEANPVMWRRDGMVAVDGLIVIEDR